MLIKHIFLPLEICNRRLTIGSNQLWFKERIIVGLKPIDCHYIHTCLVWFFFFFFERWFNDLLFTKNSRNMYWKLGWGSRVNTTKRMRHTYLLLPDLKYSLNLFFVTALIEAFQISTICLPLMQLIHGFYFF